MMNNCVGVEFSEFIGKTFTGIDGMVAGEDVVLFRTEAETYKMHHMQDCCESVHLEDVCGDVADLIGTPIIDAREESSDAPPLDNDESYTWTFYRLSTIKGAVVLRWYGSSNGYYSEEVTVVRLNSA